MSRQYGIICLSSLPSIEILRSGFRGCEVSGGHLCQARSTDQPTSGPLTKWSKRGSIWISNALPLQRNNNVVWTQRRCLLRYRRSNIAQLDSQIRGACWGSFLILVINNKYHWRRCFFEFQSLFAQLLFNKCHWYCITGIPSEFCNSSTKMFRNVYS